MTLRVSDRIRPELSDKRDPLGMIRDSINVTYNTANLAGDDAVRRVALTMLAHLSKERRAAKIPEFKRVPKVHA